MNKKSVLTLTVTIMILAVIGGNFFFRWRSLVTGATLDESASQIAWLAFRTGELGDVYVYDDASRTNVRITRTNGQIRSADWSPDGRYLVFHHDPRDGRGVLYRYDVVNGELLRLTPDDFAGCYGPDWSPNGMTIVCDMPGNYPGDGEIFLVESDGSAVTSLTRGSSPSWSADGSRLVFITAHGDDQRDLAAIDLEAQVVTILAEIDGIEDQPKWSPDGRLIAYLENHYDLQWGGVIYRTLRLWDGDQIVQVDKNFSDTTFEFSPDGNSLRYGSCQYDILSGEGTCGTDHVVAYSLDESRWAAVYDQKICVYPLDTDEDCVPLPKGDEVVRFVGWRP